MYNSSACTATVCSLQLFHSQAGIPQARVTIGSSSQPNRPLVCPIRCFKYSLLLMQSQDSCSYTHQSIPHKSHRKHTVYEQYKTNSKSSSDAGQRRPFMRPTLTTLRSPTLAQTPFVSSPTRTAATSHKPRGTSRASQAPADHDEYQHPHQHFPQKRGAQDQARTEGGLTSATHSGH